MGRTKTHTKPVYISLIPLLLIVSIFLGSCTSPNDTNTERAGHIRISGSTALYPLLDKAAQIYMQRYPAVKIEVTANGSHSGLDDVMAGRSDIGASDVYANFARYPDPTMTDHLLCVIPFAMIVHPDLPITTLTQEELTKIFSTREITNWIEVGGPDLPIVPIAREKDSGTRDTFRKYVLGGADEHNTLEEIDKSAEVFERVSQTPGAIGYISVGYLTSANKGAKAIAINNYQPTQEHIIDNRYIYWSYAHLYTRGNDNVEVEQFLQFLLEDEVQKDIALKEGYIPIADMQLPIT